MSTEVPLMNNYRSRQKGAKQVAEGHKETWKKSNKRNTILILILIHLE